MVVELRGRGSPVGEGGGTTHTLATSVGGVQLLLEVVELLSVVGVGGGGAVASHYGRVFVKAVARTPHPARREGLGGVGTRAPAATTHSHWRGF